MKKSVIASIGLILLTPAICVADDGQDAVDLLALSLKCPNKVMSEHGNGDSQFTHTISKSTGSRTHLRIETGGDVITANYVDLQQAVVAESPFGVFADGTTAFLVELTCAGDRSCIRFNSGPLQQETSQTFPVCDAETGAHVKLAISTLIRLNRQTSR
jgi:hypothetical protein